MQDHSCKSCSACSAQSNDTTPEPPPYEGLRFGAISAGVFLFPVLLALIAAVSLGGTNQGVQAIWGGLGLLLGMLLSMSITRFVRPSN